MKNFLFVTKKVFFVQLYATCFAISTAHTKENAFRVKKALMQRKELHKTENSKFFTLFNFSLIL
jgi:hypothetical protein